MQASEFESVWMEQVSIEKAMLLERADAYATNGDRLGNFKEGGQLNGCHPLRYGFNLVSKHIIALRDLIVKIEAGGKCNDEKFQEYVTDIRNYAVLLKALSLETSSPPSKQ